MSEIGVLEQDSAQKRAAAPRWSVEEEERLAEGFKAGRPMAELAADHGRSVGAVQSRLLMLDVLSYGAYTPFMAVAPDKLEEGEAPNSGKGWSEAEVAELLVMHHTGVGREDAEISALAAKLGRTPRSLALKLVQMGVVAPSVNPNPQPKPRPEPRKAAKPSQVAESRATQKISVTPEFQTAARCVLDGDHVLVLGSAGTGKSTFLRFLKKQLAGGVGGKAKRYVVLAPTGMAALNVGGQTIHSFFGFKPGVLDRQNLPKPRTPKVFEKLEVLILDEVSMVRADMFEAIDAFLRLHGPKRNQPFGGVQLCLIGDLFQLPPIVGRDEQPFFEAAYDSPYFFSSQSFRDLQIQVVEFTHVFRQADLPFIELLSHIRHGTDTAATLAALNRRVLGEGEGSAGLPTLTARVAVAEQTNQRELEALPGEGHVYVGKLTSGFDEKALPAPMELVLKPGARVMFTKNDTNQRWVNGTLGVVVNCGKSYVTVRAADGQTHVVEPTAWERTRYSYDGTSEAFTAESAGSYTQLPLALAWALTIHKSQGQTLDGAVVDLSGGGAFAEGQLYVALSRTRSLETLFLRHPISPRDVRTHGAVRAFYERLRGRGLHLAAS